jgi:hypothetical protein
MQVWIRSCALLAAALAAPAQERPPEPARMVAYPREAAAMSDSPCLYARDLPLMAAAGANTVRTYGLLPEGDRVFQAVLESSGLNWVAGFPVDRWPDRAQALAAFRSYAARFRGERRLIAWALDGELAGAELIQEAAAIVREIEPRRMRAVLAGAAVAAQANFLGPAEADLFESVPAAQAGIESLRPRASFYALAGIWRGTYPAGWSEPARPRLDPADPASAGALVRLTGSALLNAGAPYADESWPFHLGGACLCVGGQPARLSFVGRDSITVQVPPALEAGQARLVLYRAGQASNAIWLHVSEFSAGARPGPVVEARGRPPQPLGLRHKASRP